MYFLNRKRSLSHWKVIFSEPTFCYSSVHLRIVCSSIYSFIHSFLSASNFGGLKTEWKMEMRSGFYDTQLNRVPLISASHQMAIMIVHSVIYKEGNSQYFMHHVFWCCNSLDYIRYTSLAYSLTRRSTASEKEHLGLLSLSSCQPVVDPAMLLGEGNDYSVRRHCMPPRNFHEKGGMFNTPRHCWIRNCLRSCSSYLIVSLCF